MYFYLRNKEARDNALRSLGGNWGNVILATVVFAIVTFIVNQIPGMMLPSPFDPDFLQDLARNRVDGAILFSQFLSYGLLSILVSFLLLPLNWGYSVLFLNKVRNEGIEIGSLFDGYRDLGRIILTMVLMSIYTYLWSLLFIIPGIVKGYSYAMTPYILKDNPELSSNAAIDKSRAMMRGHKWQLFCLHLSFTGWAILAACTCGIGLLWLYPYIHTSQAAFYESLKAEEENLKAETESGEETAPGVNLHAEGEYAK